VNNDWYALLRPLHSAVALLLFITVMLHLAAALFHALVRRDGVFESMSGSGRR
jgi:cytochrome b561